MNYRTLSDMARTIRTNMHKIPRLPVVGIPRSGMIAASMIATLRDVPLHSVFDVQHLPSEFILVDDSVSGGQTMRKVATALKHTSSYFQTLAVYVKPNSPKPDISFEELPGPRVFEWNWAKHHYLRTALLDIDGVLCDETLHVKNWGDLEHVRAVRNNALLLHRPKHRVKCIATGRREEERPFTEAWLERMGIRYEHLYMSTPERGARRTKSLAAQETGCTWIVESNFDQACFLNELLKIPVLCTDMNMMVNGPLHMA